MPEQTLDDNSELTVYIPGLDCLAEELRQGHPSLAMDALIALLGPIEAVLLYGSRARDRQHAASDYDLLVVAKAPPACFTEGIRWRHSGVDLDIDVRLPELLDSPPGPEHVYLWPGQIWLDRRRRLERWLEELGQVVLTGPTPWSPSRRRRMLSWLERMLQRAELAPEPLASLQLARLQAELSEVVVGLHGRWPGGARADLAWIQESLPELNALLEDWSRAHSRPAREKAARDCVAWVLARAS